MSTVREGSGAAAWIKSQAVQIREAFRDLRDKVLQEKSVRLMAALGFIVFLLSILVWIVEEHAAARQGVPSSISSFGRAIYWMFISGTTTGYGDMIPETPLGRALAVAVILASMVLTSILTATIASMFVERKLLEGKGMEQITWKNHIVICGWNANGRALLDGIYRGSADGADVVLVNTLYEEQIGELMYIYKRQGLRFVRGDFVHENVLMRAKVGRAKTVVIMADGSVSEGFAGADERTILCALTVKSMNQSVEVCAELVDEENVSHLKRADVDHVVVMGEHDDFLMASAVNSPGVTVAFQELLNPDHGSLIVQSKIPLQYVDEDFGSLCRHFREKKGAMVIGILSEGEKGVGLDDILSDDMTAVDKFIKQQFEGREGDYFFKGKSMKVRLNPPDDYRVRKNDQAIMIAETGQRKVRPGACDD